MDKRFWICALVVAMAALLLGFLVHGVLLRDDYRALAALYRTQAEANANAAWILLAYASIGVSMTWLYRQLPAPEGAKAMQGLRFGLAAALLSFVPWHLLAYAGQPLPASLTLKQCAFDVVAMLLLGLLLSWLQPRRVALAEPVG
jgi:hypothetical protein